MAKKNKIKCVDGGKKVVKEEPLQFLSVRFDNINTEVVRNHIILLIIASLFTKFFVLFATTMVFHSFIDYFDFGFYLEHAMMIVQGQLPYLNYNFDYPLLIFVPILVALMPALFFHDALVFVYTFQILMVLCDLIIILCIYFIALRIYNERTAFLAALIYATAFGTAYFVLTKYDAFPTSLLMLGVLFTVYGMNMKGYLSIGIGFFAKIFPAIAFPFFILHNSKKTSLKNEVIAAFKVIIPLLVIFLLPFLVIRPEAIRTYLFATGATVGVYANTATFTLYSWLNGIGHLGILPDSVSVVMYVLMGIIILYLLYSSFVDTVKRPVTLVKTLLCAFITVILFTKFHSPQYIVWYTPFLCLLVVDDIFKIILFYIVQILAYIEFPLMFGGFYTNQEYTNPAGSYGWYLTLLFFTLQYLVLLILVFVIIHKKDEQLKTIQ
jgi:hypothetical protein